MKKGISLISLIITIIALIIVAGVIIINADYMIVNGDSAKLQTDIAQLESLMNVYKTRNSGNINFATTDFDVSKLSTTELQQFVGENIENNKIELYVIDLYEIDALNPSFGNLSGGNTDRYLYSITTGKVYYEMGIMIDGVRYYYINDGEV